MRKSFRRGTCRERVWDPQSFNYSNHTWHDPQLNVVRLKKPRPVTAFEMRREHNAEITFNDLLNDGKTAAKVVLGDKIPVDFHTDFPVRLDKAPCRNRFAVYEHTVAIEDHEIMAPALR